MSLNVLLQVPNGQMNIERQPPADALIDSEIERCQKATRKYKDWARRALNVITTSQPDALQRVFPTQPSYTDMSWECEKPIPQGMRIYTETAPPTMVPCEQMSEEDRDESVPMIIGNIVPHLYTRSREGSSKIYRRQPERQRVLH